MVEIRDAGPSIFWIVDSVFSITSKKVSGTDVAHGNTLSNTGE